MDNVIVVSLRKGSPPVPDGYTPVRIDRKSPHLGNDHPMKVETKEEGLRVIRENKKDLNNSRKENGVEWQEIEKLATRVESGEKLALQCWCAPKPCHGDNIKAVIAYVIRKRNYQNEASQPSP